jgi:hypothetical protein
MAWEKDARKLPARPMSFCVSRPVTDGAGTGLEGAIPCAAPAPAKSGASQPAPADPSPK